MKLQIEKLYNSANLFPNKLAVKDRRESYTYIQFVNEIQKLGSLLIEHSKKHVFIGVFTSNSAFFAKTFYSILFASHTPFCIDVDSTYKSIQNQISNLKSKLLIFEKKYIIKHENIVLDLIQKNDCEILCIDSLYFSFVKSRNGSIYFDKLKKNHVTSHEFRVLNNKKYFQIVHTSGSLGNPKAVAITEEQNHYSCLNIIDFCNITSNDIEVCCLPLTRLFGQLHLHSYLQSGGFFIIEPNLAQIEFSLALAKKMKATSFPHVPSGFKKILLKHEKNLSELNENLRYLLLCSMPLDKKLFSKLRECLPNTKIINSYGLTEAPRSSFIDLSNWDVNNKNIPIGNVNTSKHILLDKPLLENHTNKNIELNEILITGNHICEGYISQEMLIIASKKNGYLYTGDYGEIDENGFIYYLGRADDTINVGGKKYIPYELEETIKELNEVRDAVIVPVKSQSSILGEIPFLFLELEVQNSIIDLKDILKLLVREFQVYKLPQFLKVLPLIPKTSTNKPRRGKLKLIAQKIINENEKT